MKKKPATPPDAAEVRRQAEAKLSERKKKPAPSPATEADTRRLVHELEVHQIQLEMQNEELVQARAEVEALLHQYSGLYDFAPVGYFALARDGAIHQVNLAGANLLGLARSELIKRRFGLFVSVGSRSILSAFLEKVFSSSGSKETCEVALLKDGHEPLWAHIEATCIEDGQQCRAVVSDITERKRAEEVLAASEKRFRVAAESLVDVIYEWDLKQKIDWYGDIDRLMGNPTGGFPKTLDGWAATLHPEDKERVLAAVDAQLKGTAPYDVEYRVRKGDGEWRWWSARGTALRDERDEPYRFIGSITDTTERKRAEEEIRGLNESLERKVQERTSQLEAANKELEAFSYSVSHDLRAPLRAIDGFSRIVLDEHTPALPPEAQRYLRLVQDNTHQMERLVDDLLAFSRLSRQPMAKQLVDPAGLVRAALQDLHAEQAGRQIHLVIRDLPACQADPGLLKQVWVNLLSNALKFTRRRERAVIEVGAYEEDHHPVYYVKDNGVGFDMRYVGKLFGVFQRLHKAEEYEGTGVGLAIVQRIVHRHGGRVWAEAKVDQRATFWFTLEGGTGNDEGHGGDPAGRGQSE